MTEQGCEVTVLERNQVVGGNAGSFLLAGMNVDYGSHRLHATCDPEVLSADSTSGHATAALCASNLSPIL